jgi:hypothetical protein
VLPLPTWSFEVAQGVKVAVLVLVRRAGDEIRRAREIAARRRENRSKIDLKSSDLEGAAEKCVRAFRILCGKSLRDSIDDRAMMIVLDRSHLRNATAEEARSVFVPRARDYLHRIFKPRWRKCRWGGGGRGSENCRAFFTFALAKRWEGGWRVEVRDIKYRDIDGSVYNVIASFSKR